MGSYQKRLRAPHDTVGLSPFGFVDSIYFCFEHTGLCVAERRSEGAAGEGFSLGYIGTGLSWFRCEGIEVVFTLLPVLGVEFGESLGRFNCFSCFVVRTKYTS